MLLLSPQTTLNLSLSSHAATPDLQMSLYTRPHTAALWKSAPSKGVQRAILQ
ncbi:hypothetical protein PtrM4_122590 [Pyrenophora tritici-repentis]|uniref:Uncharacterized protein n=1 Tax=Pyrenophora tritici-repentis TaxID=45151 RepID=A0A834VP79_9PLEO|nr:hypothetical protein PtrM4_122590 [Pyrenophora tritici-repentis]